MRGEYTIDLRIIQLLSKQIDVTNESKKLPLGDRMNGPKGRKVDVGEQEMKRPNYFFSVMIV